MGYNIQVVPAPLLVNEAFEVRLEITPPDVKAGDVYEIRELGGQPVVFDVGQVTVPAGAAGSVPLVFRSNAGFPAIAMAQIAVFNMAAPAVPPPAVLPVAQTTINIVAAKPPAAVPPAVVPPAAVLPAAVVPPAAVPPAAVPTTTTTTTTTTDNRFVRRMGFVAGWGAIIVTGLFFAAVIVALVLLPFWAAGLIASHGTPNPPGSVAAPATPGGSRIVNSPNPNCTNNCTSGDVTVNHAPSPSKQPSKGKTAPKPKGSGSSGPP